MKKLPKIYQGDFDKEIHNNKESEYLFENKEKENKDSISIEDKLSSLFSSSRHVFHIPVLIETKNRVYDTKIAGKVKNYIITLDNDIIYLSDILDIKEKN